MSRSALANDGHIAAAQGLDEVLLRVPDAADDKAVHGALALYPFAPGNEPHDTQVREAAWKLYGNYQRTWLRPEAQSIRLDNAAGIAVRCNDTPAITDPAQWITKVRAMAQQAPMHFGGLLNIDACAFWGGPSVRKPDPAAMQQLPVLFVQSQYDAATITENAERFYAQLDGAWHIAVPGEYQHGLFPYQEPCLDGTVLGYLLEGPGSLPGQRHLRCPALPLAQDKQFYR